MDEPNKSNEELLYHYSRDKRLERASALVRSLYQEENKKKPNLFRTLTATKPLAYLFLGVLMLTLTALVTAFLTPGDTEGSLGSNTIAIEAFLYQGSTYIAIKKTSNSVKAYVGPVVAAISANKSPIVHEQFIFTQEKEQEFRFSVPLEDKKILIVMKAEDLLETFKVPVK